MFRRLVGLSLYLLPSFASSIFAFPFSTDGRLSYFGGAKCYHEGLSYFGGAKCYHDELSYFDGAKCYHDGLSYFGGAKRYHGKGNNFSFWEISGA